MQAVPDPPCQHLVLAYGGGCWHCLLCGWLVDPHDLT